VDPRVEEYLHALGDEAQAVLGEDLVGVYAGGSVALDEFHPHRSDVDVAVVCRSALPVASKQELVARLRHEALECPARGLELVTYREEVALAGTSAPAFELELNTGAHMAFRVTLQPEERSPADGLFWYGLDRSLLHQSGVAVVGRPASEMFADLSSQEVRNLLVTALQWWLAASAPADQPPGHHTDDAVLGACRALVRHRTGRWLSKVAAARRLLEEGHDAADVLAQSVAARSGGRPPDPARARAFQEQVLRVVSPSSSGAE
jgi:hypothetical protein